MVRRGEKRGDKFVMVEKGLPKHKAYRKLKQILDNYIEASGRARPSKTKATVIDDLTAPDLSKFRRPVPKSKLPPDTIIEKVRHRIDTIGEKQQLSYFKELAKKKKALQSQIGFIKTQQKKQQLQSAIATKQVSFISSPKSNKKQKVKPIKFL